ncbi:MAG: Prephenate dehydratase [Candidatus Methanohalarchaeum thermophilum]|uniref:prephenate dehydratase n=1 Tax=Methanohalarchaeum thermophilum TaxID=1903181 RepID=A0A1Q6DSN4_METT1|nr:MAG: Prephenate dehydratase [Candidatus Methanohalarchaeum thermophilum]
MLGGKFDFGVMPILCLMVVVSLGPKGTFSEKAAREWSDKKVRLESSSEDVVKAVEEGETGVLPFENSLEGTVLRTVDLLAAHDILIKGEVVIEIDHCLLGYSGSEIREVVSHSQALRQCREYLTHELNNIDVRAVSSTAKAVELTKSEEELAAVAPREAANEYGLDILDEGIQDVKDNLTRFLVLGLEDCPPSGNDKTTLLFYVKDRPGSLYDSLGVFAERDINLTKLESRPSREKLGDYFFILDFEGHRKDKKFKKALVELKNHVRDLKILGSYPKATNPQNKK